MIPFTFL